MRGSVDSFHQDVLIGRAHIGVSVIVRRVEHLVVFVMAVATRVPVAEGLLVFVVADGFVTDVFGDGISGPGARCTESARHQFRLENAFEGGVDGPERGVGGRGGF